MDNTTTEQAILEVAERLFLEKGFALTSTTDIAREAGCNQALINYYFRTKEKLFASIFEKKLALFLSSISGTLEKGLSFQEKIKAIAERHFAMLLQNPKIPFLVINEFSVNANRVSALKASMSQYVGSIVPGLNAELQAEIAAGRIRPMEILDLLLTMVSLNMGVFLLHPILSAVSPQGIDLQAMRARRGRENVRILLASLEPGAAE